jgi:hypothetical protein
MVELQRIAFAAVAIGQRRTNLRELFVLKTVAYGALQFADFRHYCGIGGDLGEGLFHG